MISSLLAKGRLPYLIILASLTALLTYHALNIDVEKSNRSMVAREEEQIRTYSKFRRIFGDDEDIILSVTHPRILEASGLRLLDE
jgi:predicted RND superfamily exporter protein